MAWLPADGMWLTKIAVNTPAGDLRTDLAVDASGFGQPNPAAAGLHVAQGPVADSSLWSALWVALASIVVLIGIVIIGRRRSDPRVAV